MSENLSLVSTDDLLNELKNRYDTYIMAGFKNRTETKGTIHLDWEGSIGSATFLCDYLKRDVMDFFEEETEELDEP